MKISWNNSTVVANRWRCGVILFPALCIVWVVFISSSAQLKAQKHVTSVEMIQGAEGARVTVSSDSPLNDYEAFRRGDRFYVKIPLAEFSFSQPRFQGSGFDDVQVQKLWCRPCTKMGRHKCPQGHFKCMKNIAIDDIVTKVVSRLKLSK